MSNVQLLQQTIDRLKSERPILDGSKADFIKGSGYYLRRDGHTIAYFKTYRIGVEWLNVLETTGRPNMAMLRSR